MGKIGNPAAMAAVQTFNGMSPGAKTALVIGGVALVAGAGYLAYKRLFAPVDFALETLGLKEGEEDKQIKVFEESGAMKSFDPNAWRTLGNGKHMVYTPEAAKKRARIIYNANSWYNDDENAIYGVFRDAKSWAHVSRITEAFKSLYNKDLFFFLRDILSDSEMAIVTKIIQDKRPAVYSSLGAFSFDHQAAEKAG